jgi:type II secretory pathway component PulC
MSIINEALKKTEEQLQKNTVKETVSATKPTAPKPILLYILILLAGLFLAQLIFNLLSNNIKTNLKPKANPQPVTIQPAAPAALPPLTSAPPETKKSPEATFVLNGIFFSDNSSYALVNNQIVRENDYVDGAKVNSITTRAVELENDGQIITLTTRR